MPYIPQSDRERVWKLFRETSTSKTQYTSGERCYLIYRDLLERWSRSKTWNNWCLVRSEINYFWTGWTIEIEEAVYYFRKDYIDKYEEQKRKENGNIE